MDWRAHHPKIGNTSEYYFARGRGGGDPPPEHGGGLLEAGVALAEPSTAPATRGGTHSASNFAWPSQPASQSASMSHLGGVNAPSQLGAVKSTEHSPLQVPLQATLAPASISQVPLQVPLQVPSHAPAQPPLGRGRGRR